MSVGSPSVAFEGGSFNPPRILTPPPADAVGSLAEGWVPWFESTLGITLREWQRLVLWHGLLIDESGRLVYRDLVVTAPRQEGKSWLILALASARAAHAGVFGEPQEVLHVANKLVAARRIHTRAWRWAESVGLTIKKSEGRESLVWPDDSHWTISSIGAIWGASSSTAIVDEAWEITPDVVDEALMPTLVERVQPQLWLMSTANPATTPVVPLMRRKAIRGAPRTFLAEWSMPPDADVHDPEVWRSASPHWTPQRLELMAAAQDSRGFAEQWLNRWPPIREDERSEGFPAGWDNCPRTITAPLPGLFGAVETSQDRSLFGVAVAVADPVAGGRVSVWSRSFRSLEDAASQLAVWAPSQLLVGMTLRDAFPGRWVVHPVGVKETRLATPVVADVVARHRLWHDGDVDTATQVASARTSLTEGGIVLSATRSQGPISSVKAVTWAVYAAENPDLFAAPRPRIW